jgi:glycerate 2-kinase
MPRLMDLAARPILLAPDSFKGTMRAPEVAAALARGLERAGILHTDPCPVADGGDGTLEVLLLALGGRTAAARVHDPLGREIDAGFGLVEDGGTAIVELAQASGLALVPEAERDAEVASTEGTGELIAAAVEAGAEVVLVAPGGSATTDGGEGAVAAIERAGGLGRTKLVVLCDVRTPWERAAEVFGPQKGADPPTVKRLAKRLRTRAGKLRRDPTGVPMTGAGGGIAGGLWAELDATLEPGARFVLDTLDFDVRMRAARAVITGEGRLDEQSLTGKAVGEIGTRCRQAGVPLHAVVGQNALDRFGARMIDLQRVVEAGTPADIEAAAASITDVL